MNAKKNAAPVAPLAEGYVTTCPFCTAGTCVRGRRCRECKGTGKLTI